MKLILTSILTLMATVSFAHVESNGIKIKCDWVKSSSNSTEYFVKASGFTMHFFPGGKVRIIEDTFFNRTYKPCWTGGFESCMFSFSYDVFENWSFTPGSGKEGDAGVLTQVWNSLVTQPGDAEGEDPLVSTVSGVSEIKFYDNNQNGELTVIGDDGDGTMFKENFSCGIVNSSGEDLDATDLWALIFSED